MTYKKVDCRCEHLDPFVLQAFLSEYSTYHVSCMHANPSCDMHACQPILWHVWMPVFKWYWTYDIFLYLLHSASLSTQLAGLLQTQGQNAASTDLLSSSKSPLSNRDRVSITLGRVWGKESAICQQEAKHIEEAFRWPRDKWPGRSTQGLGVLLPLLSLPQDDLHPWRDGSALMLAAAKCLHLLTVCCVD